MGSSPGGRASRCMSCFYICLFLTRKQCFGFLWEEIYQTNKHKEIRRDTPTSGRKSSRGGVPLVSWKCPVCSADILSNLCGIIRERPRGVENSGGGEHTVNSAKNPSPKTFLDPPHTIRFPPPPFFGNSLSFPLKARGTDQTNPNFWGLQKCFWRAHSAVRFPPPKFTRYVLPPPQPLPKITHKLGRDVPDVKGLAPKPSPGHFRGTQTVKFLYATARFLEGFLKGPLTVSASQKGS